MEINGKLLINQLFGSELEDEMLSPWNELVTQKWHDLSRINIPVDQRKTLLNKNSPPEAVAFLKVSTLNQVCRIALNSNSMIKSVDYSCRNQNQVSVALGALGKAISDFLKPDI